MKITLLALALAATPALARAEAVSLNVGGLEKQIYLPAKLAEALGYYKDEGLDVTLESEGAGVEGADALIAGEVEGVVGFYDHTIDLASKGKHAESIVQFSRAPGCRSAPSARWRSARAAPSSPRCSRVRSTAA